MGVHERIAQKVLKAIDEEEVIGLTSSLIKINSNIEAENVTDKEIADFLADYWKRIGFDAHIQEFEKDFGKPFNWQKIFNPVGIRKGLEDGPTFMLGGHIDTEPIVAPGKWTYDPYSGHIDRQGDMIFGLGAVNQKQGVAAMTAAAHALVKAGVKLKGALILAGFSRENIGILGSQYMAEHLGEDVPKPDAVLCTEATNCSAIRSTNVGIINLTITTKGRKTHISGLYHRHPDYVRGINAFDHMMKILGEIKDIRKNFTYTRHPYIGHPIFCVGNVHTGDIKNLRPCLIPDVCTADIDFRYLPGQTPETIIENIQEVINRLWQEDHDLDATVEMWPGMRVPPSDFQSLLGKDHFLVQAVKRAHKNIWGTEIEIDFEIGTSSSMTRAIDRGKWAATDAHRFMAVGIPALNYGAGTTPVRPDENVSISQLINCTKVYALAILDVCGVVEN